MELYKFNSLKDEAIRQFEEQRLAIQQTLNMSQVLIVLSTGFLLVALLDNYSSIEKIDIYYIIPILISAGLGLWGYYLRSYHLGTNVEDIYKECREDKKTDSRVLIFKGINEANRDNRKSLLKRNKILKAGYIIYAFGIISFLATKVINLYL